MQLEFVLFGHYAGQTVAINGHAFFDGRCTMEVGAESLPHVTKYLASYQAYARGSVAYDEAVKKEAEANGASEADTDEGSGLPSDSESGVQSSGAEPSESDAEDGAGDASGVDGEAGSGAAGNGRTDPWVPEQPEKETGAEPDNTLPVNEKLKTALMGLDPENDDHWVSRGQSVGKPKLKAVEEAYGSTGVTGRDVEAVIAGFDRNMAKELRAL